jgi:hypothetical protein
MRPAGASRWGVAISGGPAGAVIWSGGAPPLAEHGADGSSRIGGLSRDGHRLSGERGEVRRGLDHSLAAQCAEGDPERRRVVTDMPPGHAGHADAVGWANRQWSWTVVADRLHDDRMPEQNGYDCAIVTRFYLPPRFRFTPRIQLFA